MCICRRRQSEALNSFAGTITAESFLGDHTEYTVAVGGRTLKAKSATDLAVGSPVHVWIDPSRVVCLTS